MAQNHCAINPRNICKKCGRIFASCSMQISTPNFLPRKLCQSKNVCSNLLSAYRPDLSNMNFLFEKKNIHSLYYAYTKLQSEMVLYKNSRFLWLGLQHTNMHILCCVPYRLQICFKAYLKIVIQRYIYYANFSICVEIFFRKISFIFYYV